MTTKKGLDDRLEQVLLLAERVSDPLGLKVVEVKIGQEGKRRTLEVTVFRPDEAVSHDDCQTVSRELEILLDELAGNDSPLVDGSYSLVVQSPGITRKLKTERDLQIFSGQAVQVQTKEKIALLGNSLTGILIGFAPDWIKLAHPRAFSANAKSSKSAKKSQNPAPSEHEDMEIQRSLILEIKLFAKDLMPKEK